MTGWLYLNHILSEATPLYGGKGNVQIPRVQSMTSGASSNNSDLAFPAHSGTHIDAPCHFDITGASLDSYPPEYWYAEHPWLIDIPCDPETVLDCAKFGSTLESVPECCDLLLLRTGAEKWRDSQTALYTQQGPGIAPDVAHWLRRHRKLKFLGMDFISVSSFAHRDIGRESHRAFLVSYKLGNSPILLVEDMALGKLVKSPESVWIVPLLYNNADGAPVTVLAKI